MDPRRALQVQVQPPRGPARCGGRLVGAQEDRPLLPAPAPGRPAGLLPGARVAPPRAQPPPRVTDRWRPHPPQQNRACHPAPSQWTMRGHCQLQPQPWAQSRGLSGSGGFCPPRAWAQLARIQGWSQASPPSPHRHPVPSCVSTRCPHTCSTHAAHTSQLPWPYASPAPSPERGGRLGAHVHGAPGDASGHGTSAGLC